MSMARAYVVRLTEQQHHYVVDSIRHEADTNVEGMADLGRLLHRAADAIERAPHVTAAQVKAIATTMNETAEQVARGDRPDLRRVLHRAHGAIGAVVWFGYGVAALVGATLGRLPVVSACFLLTALLYPAEPGDGCSSRCATPAAYRVGWANPGDDRHNPVLRSPRREPHRKAATQ